MRPVHTDSSNTAASGEFNLNIIMEMSVLVTARPIVAFKRLLPITVHTAAMVVANKSIVSILIVTGPVSPLWAILKC